MPTATVPAELRWPDELSKREDLKQEVEIRLKGVPRTQRPLNTEQPRVWKAAIYLSHIHERLRHNPGQALSTADIAEQLRASDRFFDEQAFEDACYIAGQLCD